MLFLFPLNLLFYLLILDFLIIVKSNNIISCETKDINSLSLIISKYLISMPSIVIFPFVGSINLGIRFKKVDFPEPLLPTKTKFSLAFILNLLNLKIYFYYHKKKKHF